MISSKLLLEYTKELTVLYVEDDILLRNSMVEMFQSLFGKIDTANNGKNGLWLYETFLEAHGRPYDLVITDISMPHMDGIEMSRAILKLQEMQLIIFVSAHNEVNYLQDAISLGISGFINKPVNTSQLNTVLYRTAQAISDHRFVETHIQQMEELNLQLEAQNKELQLKNRELEKSLRLLDTTIQKEHFKTVQKSPTPKIEYEQNIHIHEQLHSLVTDDLYELMELLREIDNMIISMISHPEEVEPGTFEHLIESCSRYASILSMYTFFHDLSVSMRNFIHTMKNTPLPSNPEDIKNIFMLMESYVFVLGKWQEEVRQSDIERINEYDASLINDMKTIENLWKQEEAEGANNLDAIFDF